MTHWAFLEFLIAHLAPTLAALAAWLKARHAAQALMTVKVQINSRMDQLLAQARDVGYLQGRADERAATAESRP